MPKFIELSFEYGGVVQKEIIRTDNITNLFVDAYDPTIIHIRFRSEENPSIVYHQREYYENEQQTLGRWYQLCELLGTVANDSKPLIRPLK